MSRMVYNNIIEANEFSRKFLYRLHSFLFVTIGVSFCECDIISAANNQEQRSANIPPTHVPSIAAIRCCSPQAA
jgi:hypothetical protein